MIRQLFSIVLIATLIVSIGCKKEPEKPAPTSKEETNALNQIGQSIDKVQADAVRRAANANEAVEEQSADWEAKRDAFVASAKEKLAELDAEAEDLQEKLAAKQDELSDEAKAKWETALAKLEEQKADLAAQWEAWNAEGGKIDEAKKNIDEAAAKVKSYLQNLKEKFEGNEDPDTQ